MTKEHGNTGKRNAAKNMDNLNCNVHIRCLSSDKKKWKKQAKNQHVSLSELITLQLNKCVDK